MLIGSGTMDVGELLSYQVGEVDWAGGSLIPAEVAGPEFHLASSWSLALTSHATPGCILSLHFTPQALVDSLDSFLLQA